MKLLLVSAVLIVLLGSKISGSAHYPITCCSSYVSRKILRSHVLKYFRTSNHCAQPGVIFITRHRKVCADPKKAWVQDYMKQFSRS